GHCREIHGVVPDSLELDEPAPPQRTGPRFREGDRYEEIGLGEIRSHPRLIVWVVDEANEELGRGRLEDDLLHPAVREVEDRDRLSRRVAHGFGSLIRRTWANFGCRL